MKSQKFRALLAKSPDNGLFQFSLGQSLVEENTFEEAIASFDTCLQKKPDWMMASILKSKSLIALQRHDEARTELGRALKLAVDQRHEAPEAEIRKLLASLPDS